MTGINTAWVNLELAEFIRLTDGRVHDGEDFGFWFKSVGSNDDILKQWVIVKRILDRLSPGWKLSDEKQSAYASPWQHERDLVLELQVEVERELEFAENLGDGAPTMSVSQLHPWVREGARSLWRSGHYRSAVMDAASKVNAETQNKLGHRRIGEVKLFNEAFSEKAPEPDQPRLRRMPPEDSETYRSLQRGARSLAEGFFAGIRNPHIHGSGTDLDEQVALEYLATLSVLARWVDDSVVDSVE